MINVTNKENCCGCGACVQGCPVQCIHMEADQEGFLYPIVDQERCIQCGLCNKICPLINTKDLKSDVLETKIAYAQDEELRRKSSSGAIFSLCATAILEQGGVIYGAAFDEDFRVHHMSVDTIEKLDLLRGSKYVQSDTENTFSEVRQYLEQGKKVLFTGTACQIAGLKSYLRKEWENLYTIDVLCHGVPSPALWKQYLKEKSEEYGAGVKNVSFRSKSIGWKQFAMCIEFLNETMYERVFTKDAFMTLFLGNISLRPSCYACGFKGMPRVSDLTIGDCWGVEDHTPHMDDNKGTSVVVVNSEKGEELVKLISPNIVCCDVDLDRAVAPMAESRRSVTKHLNRKQFFKKLERGSSTEELLKTMHLGIFKRAYRKYRRLTKKI